MLPFYRRALSDENVLGLGFSIMAFSTLTAFIKMGVFGALAIFTALLCDLFLLPALILVFKPRFQKTKKPAFSSSDKTELPVKN